MLVGMSVLQAIRDIHYLGVMLNAPNLGPVKPSGEHDVELPILYMLRDRATLESLVERFPNNHLEFIYNTQNTTSIRHCLPLVERRAAGHLCVPSMTLDGRIFGWPHLGRVFPTLSKIKPIENFHEFLIERFSSNKAYLKFKKIYTLNEIVHVSDLWYCKEYHKEFCHNLRCKKLFFPRTLEHKFCSQKCQRSEKRFLATLSDTGYKKHVEKITVYGEKFKREKNIVCHDIR